MHRLEDLLLQLHPLTPAAAESWTLTMQGFRGDSTWQDGTAPIMSGLCPEEGCIGN